MSNLADPSKIYSRISFVGGESPHRTDRPCPNTSAALAISAERCGRGAQHTRSHRRGQSGDVRARRLKLGAKLGVEYELTGFERTCRCLVVCRDASMLTCSPNEQPHRLRPTVAEPHTGDWSWTPRHCGYSAMMGLLDPSRTVQCAARPLRA